MSNTNDQIADHRSPAPRHEKDFVLRFRVGNKPTIVKEKDCLKIYPGKAALTVSNKPAILAHGGHQPVIIIVDDVEVTIDAGSQDYEFVNELMTAN